MRDPKKLTSEEALRMSLNAIAKVTGPGEDLCLAINNATALNVLEKDLGLRSDIPADYDLNAGIRPCAEHVPYGAAEQHRERQARRRG
jgi:hypothetical protein